MFEVRNTNNPSVKNTGLKFQKLRMVTIHAGTALTTLIATAPGLLAFAAGNNASQIMETIIKFIGTLVIVLAIMVGIMGIIHYAQANSEGDGPAKQKATMQLASSAMLVIVGIALTAGAPTLVNLLANQNATL